MRKRILALLLAAATALGLICAHSAISIAGTTRIRK